MGVSGIKEEIDEYEDFDLELDEINTYSCTTKKDGIENEVASKKLVSFVRDRLQ